MSGLDKSVIARWEGARGSAEVERLATAVAAAGADLAVALPALAPDAAGQQFLRASTTQRFLASVGGDKAVLRALDRVAWQRVLVLAPGSSVGVWLPDVQAALPIAVLTPTLLSRSGRPWTDDALLSVSVGPYATAGLVPVGVGPRSQVWVHPPDHPLMALDPWLSARLRGVAELLDGSAARDEARRRSAAHRDSDVLREEGLVVTRKKYKLVPSPDPDLCDRRDWRLGGEATFDQWLTRRGFGRLRG